VRQLPASKDVNTEAEEATTLEAVTRRKPVKIQHTEKTSNVENCRVCELAIVLQLIVVTICKLLINPIINQNPVYSHSYT
jgi:hypothetical protein